MTFWNILRKKNQETCVNQPNDFTNKTSILISDFNHNNKTIQIFITKSKNLDLYALEKLCDTVGWVRRPLRKVKVAIDNSFLTISLFYKQANKIQLIAFARVTSDQTFNATIWDVVVHPDFQRQGFGKLLIHEIIKQLRYYEINTITLFADPQVINFYKNLGFIPDPDGVKGMFWYPKL